MKQNEEKDEHVERGGQATPAHRYRHLFVL
jgi:hypothetical protein